MNNEQYQQIIDEAYENYNKSFEPTDSPYDFRIKGLFGAPVTKEEFTNKCKIDSELSEKWLLKIEERELSLEERNEWFKINLNGNNPFMKSDWKDYELDQQNVPIKLITITYKDKTIESYE